MFSTYFRKTIDIYGITGKSLSQLTGISENHISEFKRGKRSITADVLWRLLLAMDEIEPGSRKYFCDLLAGIETPPVPGRKMPEIDYLVQRIRAVPNRDFPKIVRCVADRMDETLGEVKVVVGHNQP